MSTRRKTRTRAKRGRDEADSKSRTKKRTKKLEDDEDDDDQDLFKQSDQEEEEDVAEDLVHFSEDDDDGEDEDFVDDADADASEESEDEYDDDLIGDAEDRKYLDSLKQVEREKILSERYEARKQREERRDAKQRMRDAKQRTSRAKKKKPKARKKSKKSQDKISALHDLKKRRERLETQTRQWEEEESDEDFVAEEDFEEVEETSRKAKRKRKSRTKSESNEEEAAAEEQIGTTRITLPHLIGIQLRRLALEKLIDEPYFEDYVKGMFVKLFIGSSSRSQRQVYRCCEIKGVRDYMRSYRFANQDTKKALLLSYGNAEKVWKMEVVSNRSITEDEFDAWVGEMESQNLRVLTAEEALDRKKRAEKLQKEFEYTPELINEMIEKRKQMSLKHVNVTQEKTTLRLKIERAQELQNAKEVARLQKRLDELDEFASKQRQMSSSGRTFGISTINQKSKQANLRLLDDIAKNQNKMSSEEKMKLDPFRRRATRPVLTWGTDVQPKPESKTASKETPAKKKKSGEKVIDTSMLWLASPTGKTPRQGKKPFSFEHIALAKDPAWRKLVELHNVELDIDLNAKPKPPSVYIHPSRYHLTKGQPISLEEYDARFNEEADSSDEG